MFDDPPGSFAERRKYKRYKLELICSEQSIRDDLEFLRTSEEGALISILPTGEKDANRSVKFTVQNKSFHEIDYDSGDISQKAYRTVNALIDHMIRIPVSVPPVINQPTSTAATKPLLAGAASFQKPSASADGRSYQIFSKIGGGNQIIDNKFKIKPSDGSDKT